MLMPKKVKHRKQQRGRTQGQSQGRHRGHLRRLRHPGPRARVDHRPPDRGRPNRHDPQHQAWRQGLDQRLPDKPVTEKPAETRMGSGKGNPEHWVAVVKPGRILFELSYPDEELARGRHRAGPSRSCRSRPASCPGGGAVMAARDQERLSPARRRRPRARSWTTPRRSCSTCASRTPPASSTTSRAAVGSARTWPASTPSCGPARSRPPRRWRPSRRTA